MPKSRLLLFLSDAESPLSALRQTLTRACERAALPPPEVRWADGALTLAEAGWRVAELSTEDSGAESKLVQHLDTLTRALARDVRGQVVGLFADKARSRGQTTTSEPGRSSRSFSGDWLDVLRQMARWLNVEPAVVGRLFSQGRNQLASPVQFGTSGPSEPLPPPVDMDEDDRFVEAKLAEARNLMARYLRQRK